MYSPFPSLPSAPASLPLSLRDMSIASAHDRIETQSVVGLFALFFFIGYSIYGTFSNFMLSNIKYISYFYCVPLILCVGINVNIIK